MKDKERKERFNTEVSYLKCNVQLCINCKEKPANRGLGEHKLVCSECWNKLCD